MATPRRPDLRVDAGEVIAEDLPPMEITPLAVAVPMSFVFDDVEHRTVSGIIQLQYHVRRRRSRLRQLAKASQVPLATTDQELREWHDGARGKVHSSTKTAPPVVLVSPKQTPRRQQHPLRLVICGPPAGGKGTQCERLVAKFGVVHLSTGDMLRAAIQANSDTGVRAKTFMDAGTLVPDDLIVHVILERLREPDCAQRGWLLDGFPRTGAQAQAMVDAGIVPDLVIVLHVPDDEVVSRISGRRVDLATGKTYHVSFSPPPAGVDVVQRSDDNEDTIRVRLATYHANVDSVKPASTSPLKKKSPPEAEKGSFRMGAKPQISFKQHHVLMESPPKRAEATPKDAPLPGRCRAKRPERADHSSPSKPMPPKVVICGPPAGGKGTQCELLVQRHGLVHLSTGDMLRTAIHTNSDVGRHAKAFMDEGQLVPDELIVGVILDRLQQSDCVEKGWLLDGFPRNSAQAQALLDAGISPSLVVVLNVPDDVVVSRIAGRRLDPVTGKTYHLAYNPPPEGVHVVQRSDDNEETIRTRLATYHEHCSAVVGSFSSCCPILTVDGALPKEDIAQTIAQAMEPTQKPQPAQPPRPLRGVHPLRLVICGPPAGGKGTQCERLAAKFGVVHLSTGDMLRAAIQANSDTGVRAKTFMDAGTLVPDDLIVHVILERLREPDCAQRGWLLDGFPRTGAQAQAMVDAGIVPDLVIVLHVPDDEVVSRISGRRVDLATGKTYHVSFNPPPPEVEVVQRSDDNEDTIRVRLATYHANVDSVVDKFVPLSTILHVDGMLPKPDVVRLVDSSIESVQKKRLVGKPKLDDEVLRQAKKAVLRHAAAAVSKPEATPPRVAVLGPPGAGKSHHCQWLHDHLGLVHLSVGEMLRRAIEAGAPVGLKAKVYVDRGDVVPDALIVGTTVELLRARECRMNGWVLDGFPRTIGQAKALVEHAIVPDVVIILDVVDDSDIVHRITGRRIDPATGDSYHVTFDPPPPGVVVEARVDDTEAAVRLGLAQYRTQCAEIEAFLGLHTKVVHVDGCLSKQHVDTHLNRLFPSSPKKKPKQPSSLRPPKTFAHSHATSTRKKGPVSPKPVKLPLLNPRIVAAYSPPKDQPHTTATGPKSTYDEAAKMVATDNEIQAALAELHEVQEENCRLKQLFLDTSKHAAPPTKDGAKHKACGQREYDMVLDQLASEQKSLQKVTKRQKESIDANEWETLLQRTMTELDTMRKKIQSIKRQPPAVASVADDEAKLKAAQTRHDQLKATWRQLNQPDSVNATETEEAKAKLLKKEKALARTDEEYYMQKAIHVQASTTNEVQRMQREAVRLQEAIAAAQAQLDACVAECGDLQRQLGAKGGAFLPKLPNARPIQSVASKGESHQSLPPITTKKPHTGGDISKKRVAMPPLHHTARDK